MGVAGRLRLLNFVSAGRFTNLPPVLLVCDLFLTVERRRDCNVSQRS